MTIDRSIRFLESHITFMGAHSYIGHPGVQRYPQNFKHTLNIIKYIKRK